MAGYSFLVKRGMIIVRDVFVEMLERPQNISIPVKRSLNFNAH
jgi:hypothetical protein